MRSSFQSLKSNATSISITLFALFCLSVVAPSCLLAQGHRPFYPQVVRKADGHLEAYFSFSQYQVSQNIQQGANGPWGGWQVLFNSGMIGNVRTYVDYLDHTHLVYEQNDADQSNHHLIDLDVSTGSSLAAIPDNSLGIIDSDVAVAVLGPSPNQSLTTIAYAAASNSGQIIETDRINDAFGPHFGPWTGDGVYADHGDEQGFHAPQMIRLNNGGVFTCVLTNNQSIVCNVGSPVNLGGQLFSDPSLVEYPDHLQVTALGGDSAVWVYESNNYSGWWSLGGRLYSTPASIVNSNGQGYVFALGGDSAIWARIRHPGGNWGNWFSLSGQLIHDPTGILTSDGRVQVFAVGSNDGQIWTSVEDSPGSGTFNGWSSLTPPPPGGGGGGGDGGKGGCGSDTCPIDPSAT